MCYSLFSEMTSIFLHLLLWSFSFLLHPISVMQLDSYPLFKVLQCSLLYGTFLIWALPPLNVHTICTYFGNNNLILPSSSSSSSFWQYWGLNTDPCTLPLEPHVPQPTSILHVLLLFPFQIMSILRAGTVFSFIVSKESTLFCWLWGIVDYMAHYYFTKH
jgi:hypothetical protein